MAAPFMYQSWPGALFSEVINVTTFLAAPPPEVTRVATFVAANPTDLKTGQTPACNPYRGHTSGQNMVVIHVRRGGKVGWQMGVLEYFL
jgi:hypothetical protein